MRKNFEKVKRFVLSPIGILLGVLVSSALSGTVEAVESSPQLELVGKFVGVFALLGAFVGIIYATHPGEAFQIWDRPVCPDTACAGRGGDLGRRGSSLVSPRRHPGCGVRRAELVGHEVRV